MKKIITSLGKSILPLIIDLHIRTLKINIHNKPDPGSNNIFIFWHSKMMIGWWLFKNKKPVALVSKSSDGDILNSLLNKWKYKVVRGSSSSGGREALHELIIMVQNEYSAVITPDGPRGPANEIKNGALMISNECGLPIIPVKIIFRRKKVLYKSWDKFEIPLPFSECDVYFGNKYYYDKFLEGEDLIKFKKTVSDEM